VETSGLILEGLVTTVQADGSCRVAPMGPRILGDFDRLLLRPFPTSQTYQNLAARPEGVFHVVDDVLLLARAAVGQAGQPTTRPAVGIQGFILEDACRAYEFRIIERDETGERMALTAEIVTRHAIRDFWGFNRARHAVVELAILMTRRHFLSPELIQGEIERLRPWVVKTGGTREHQAFDFLAQLGSGAEAR
jgi:uncharacterized protein